MPAETGRSKKHRESRIRKKMLKGEGWKEGKAGRPALAASRSREDRTQKMRTLQVWM